MITVWKFRGKKRWLVGQYPGNITKTEEVFKALDKARQDCPTGKLIAMKGA